MKLTDYQLLKWNEEQVKNFWDYESNFPERYFTFKLGKQIAQWVKHKCKNRTINVLDYGCGAGFLSAELLNQSMNTTAYDYSPNSVNIVNEKFKHNPLFNGAFNNVQLIKDKGLTFDVIICCEVVEHLYDDYLIQLLDNIKELMTENTICIFTTPNDENLEESFLICPSTNKLYHRWQHVRSWNGKTLKTYLDKYFENVETEVINFSTLYSIKNKLKHYLRIIIKKYLLKHQIDTKPKNLIAICKL